MTLPHHGSTSERMPKSLLCPTLGDLNDHESLMKSIKAVDVVISAIGIKQIKEQIKLIAAIKEAGTIKRFFPSKFGTDIDHGHVVGPSKMQFEAKPQVRQIIKDEGIPYTFVVCNFFAGYFLPTIGQAALSGLPTDKYTILGNGNTKAVFLDEDDIATFTIKAVDDPRTLNKILHMRPAMNSLSQNELIALWEKKTGKTFERIYLPEEEVVKKILESPFPLNIVLDVCYSAYVKGGHTGFEIDPAVAVEASELYPDVKYTTIDEYLNRFL
ncbi:Isoflavone reductase-like protein [Rhynchospora pubera]|uniref:Isoflavone reductase-like protein n=1 Tax=Rhynchospora pubera TaxID=906938 RepID=A0AAV8GW12_9POAL|nr:Isoflavone reductase-like protein [Rhynchospora pubera]